MNGRPVRDRVLLAALKAAYADVLAPDRHPAAVLRLTVPGEGVDVNVHPQKAEVRFSDPARVRAFVLESARAALADALACSAPGHAERLAAAVRDGGALLESEAEGPLGRAVGQLFDGYIVAQAKDRVVLIDQHAAHERVIYENLKRALMDGPLPRRALAEPCVVALRGDALDGIEAAAPELARLGLEIEPFGSDAVLVRSVPAAFPFPSHLAAAVADLADAAAESGAAEALAASLCERLAAIGCRSAVKDGNALDHEAMNALLRNMERTPNAGVCIHGRPTVIHLSRADIARLFGR